MTVYDYTTGLPVELPDPGPPFPRRYENLGARLECATTGNAPTSATGGGFADFYRAQNIAKLEREGAAAREALARYQAAERIRAGSAAAAAVLLVKLRARDRYRKRCLDRAIDLVLTPLTFLVQFTMLSLLVASLQGCASFTKPARELRVTEYSGNASPGLVGAPYVSGDLVVGGCRLVLSVNDSAGCLRYQGEACSYASQDCTP